MVDSKTPLCHTNTLLTILQPHFPSLPKDGRSLLESKRHYNIENVAGGEQHHFEVEEVMKIRLQEQELLRMDDKLTLQINIDGLPLFKSSTDNFWPILGLIREEN